MSFVPSLSVTPPGDDGPDPVAASPLLCTGRSPATERLTAKQQKETAVERDKALEMARGAHSEQDLLKRASAQAPPDTTEAVAGGGGSR